jgi:branched-subunit amino acid aminotransferase/4-amino-4-deoxychorismate lyase
MTSIETDNADASPTFADHWCYRSGDWVRYHDLRISVDDLGFRQGVVAVERIRTYSGIPFQVAAHLSRWQHSVESLGLGRLPSQSEISALLSALLRRNEALVARQQDLGITMLGTPGLANRDQPTLLIHLNPIDLRQIQHRRQFGQPLILTAVQQPSAACWPRSIKVRSRIHYYLADQQARQTAPNAIGVLIDEQGQVTETSIANVAIVRSGAIVSPPVHSVLGGITQQVIESLADHLQIEWHKQAIAPEELRQADEVLLMGTDGGLWFASAVDRQQIGNGCPGPLYLRLRDQFDAFVASQSLQASNWPARG